MLNLEKITKIGNMLDEELPGYNKSNTELRIGIDEEHFKKLDEDLFYRLKTEGEFIPSDKEIIIEFKKFNFIVTKKEKKLIHNAKEN